MQVVHDELPERYRIVAVLGAGLGLRQGEIMGRSPDDIDFLGERVRVVRQVKGGKTRTVPLPGTVAAETSAHMAAFPAQRVALPWRETDGASVTVSPLVTTALGTPCNRRHINVPYWKPALVKAGSYRSRSPAGGTTRRARTGRTPYGTSTPACSSTPASRSRPSRST